LTPYQDSISKIEFAVSEKIRSFYQNAKELPDSIRNIIKELRESTYSQIKYIGKVNKYNILKHEKKDNIEAMIYESRELEGDISYGESGIWIGYSENNGTDWNYYYTGIVQRQPVYIKHYSQRALIKENGKLEIDIGLLRQLSAFCHPCPSPDYECVKDGIYIVFDINLIAKDTDGDGLTDIVEDKLHLNKYKKDTDGDGISDNLDLNPRVHYPQTEKSKIYEAILDNNIEWDTKKGFDGIGKLTFTKDYVHVTDSTETILIVTDNEDLMGIHPQKHRVIFMKTDEYDVNAKSYKTDLNKMSISPLFNVDGKKDTYKVRVARATSGCSYLIRKTKGSWTIRRISMWIS
jgi:hypothetical protein